MIKGRPKIKSIQNRRCELCDLHRSSVNVCIYGRGSFDAPIMLVGEAPGEAETHHNKPFMGRSGQLLNESLRLIAMSDIVYITNATRCRPPENRNPSREEIDACYQYLINEVSMVRPKVILLMGRISCKAFDIGNHIKATSSPFTLSFDLIELKCRARVTWHPSYVLRCGGKSSEAYKRFTRHLKWAKTIAQERIH